MIQLNFLNAQVEDTGSGLIVNGKELSDIISAALGTIKRIPDRYDYISEKDKGTPFKSKLCNVSVTIDDRSADITETITFDDKSGSEEYTLEEFEKGLENEHSQKTQQADPEE